MQYLKMWIWPGLAAVACLSALALWFEAAGMESELRSRTLSALRQNHAWAQVGTVGRSIVLSGLAPDKASQDSAMLAARNVAGVRKVVDSMALLPEESPYRLSAEKTASGIILSGFVPHEAARAAIISTLTGLLPGIAVSDQMKPARGAPADLVSLASHGLAVFPRFSTGKIEITDDTIRVSGQALNPDDHEVALEVLASIPAGALSATDISPAPVSGVYSWTAVLTADTLVIGGYVPDDTMRKAIMEHGRAISEARDVKDQMRFAAGVPDAVDWLAAAETGLKALQHLSEGSVMVQNTTLGVQGEARDAQAYRTVDSLLSGKLPNGVVLGTADIGIAGAKDAVWTASFADRTLELRGAVPGSAVREKLLYAAALKFGRARIDDRLTAVEGRPDGFEEAALVALQALSRLEQAEVRIEDGVVHVEGRAFNPASRAEVERLLGENLPPGFSAHMDISELQEAEADLAADTCQAELNDLLSHNSVLFHSGETSIQDHSHGFLDRIARVVQRCGTVRVEVSGHSDADGEKTENLALSVRRAESVIEFLRAAGVERGRLVAAGAGETDSIDSADKETAEAANSRIEFRVLNQPD
ncbi:OOP family OmpA-OmpF porin [Hoeflea halophila]|uniref:OOP family OmpA-OmpF porin n=1 Tax=Hoeflea halophila TaxID=714899 RepID=A0A286HM39_9HYPH|nr:OmpA family protein [Hoeflea halophila]SOE08893.1 OOP family OmpA-OmpF porin [Hoeflea halophila]